MKSYDAIVIGSGVNGLTCAAYLGRAGMSVLVLEARDDVGGMAELAGTVGRLSPGVARDLGLRRHGLRLVQPDVRVFAPQPDGAGALTLWGDPARTAAELADNPLVGHSDAEAYAAADERFRALGAALAPVLRSAPADLASASLGRRVASLARLSRVDPALLRALPMAARDLVSEWFASDALRAALAARGVLYTGLAPRAPGTAAVLITDGAGTGGGSGLAGHAVFARGGPAAVAQALAAAVREHGGEIRTAARVARVRHDRAVGRAIGVTMDSGEELDASVVVSTLDPQTTLLDLLDPEVLGPRLSWRAANIRQQGVTARVEFGLKALPSFPAAAGEERRLRGRIVIAPSLRYLDLATRAARHDQTADEPLIEATIPTLIDPSLLDGRKKRVKHVLSVVVQAVAPDAAAPDVADLALRTLEPYAPGLSGLVLERSAVVPSDLAREYGARGGHPMHAEVALDQWYEWRPLHGLGRYRMPLDGYFLAGAGAHPGGGVTGAPGRLAALEILAESRRVGRTLRA